VLVFYSGPWPPRGVQGQCLSFFKPIKICFKQSKKRKSFSPKTYFGPPDLKTWLRAWLLLHPVFSGGLQLKVIGKLRVGYNNMASFGVVFI